jgi:hypothetical protein
MECLAALSLLYARSLVPPDVHRRARALLTRIVAMLTRLSATMQTTASLERPVNDDRRDGCSERKPGR